MDGPADDIRCGRQRQAARSIAARRSSWSAASSSAAASLRAVAASRSASGAFAKDPESDDGYRVMSQEKNNAGEEDLALVYAIEKQVVRTDSNRTADVARFVIVGESDRTVGDVLRDIGRSGGSSR